MKKAVNPGFIGKTRTVISCQESTPTLQHNDGAVVIYVERVP